MCCRPSLDSPPASRSKCAARDDARPFSVSSSDGLLTDCRSGAIKNPDNRQPRNLDFVCGVVFHWTYRVALRVVRSECLVEERSFGRTPRRRARAETLSDELIVDESPLAASSAPSASKRNGGSSAHFLCRFPDLVRERAMIALHRAQGRKSVAINFDSHDFTFTNTAPLNPVFEAHSARWRHPTSTCPARAVVRLISPRIEKGHCDRIMMPLGRVARDP